MKRVFLVVFCLFFVGACVLPAERPSGDSARFDFGGGDAVFKVPVPQGYDWEITQSWSKHCEYCSEKYSDWDYCGFEMSHNGDCCLNAWDFNLPGNSDLGKSVLATGAGFVKDVGFDNNWGYFTLLKHERGLCSRYAHMKEGSNERFVVGDEVCQGLKIGEIGESGNSEGPHLHFQFENCDDPGISIEMGFTDGNGIPRCARGADVYDPNGNYTLLILSNEERASCGPGGGGDVISELPTGGWVSSDCGSLSGCPMSRDCSRSSSFRFGDHAGLSSSTSAAAYYLYRECALNGKADGEFHPNDKITRAEALKVTMSLFGLMQNCGRSEPFEDVSPDDWYFPVVACAVQHGIVSTVLDAFSPNSEVAFVEAAKFLVLAAYVSGVIEVRNTGSSHFQYVDRNHWAYPYVETLHLYGGIDSSWYRTPADYKISRSDFVKMAASLSPCFCGNVKCERGCVCDQDVFACVDPSDNSSGTGGVSGGDGGVSEIDEVNERDGGASSELPEECVPDCAGKQCGPDYCGGFCGYCAPGRRCDYDAGRCLCADDGCGGYCGDCESGYECTAGRCVCIPKCENKECGFDGCNGWCGACGAGSVCREGLCVVDPCIYCPIDAECVDGVCMAPEWTCDEDKGYTLFVYSEGGRVAVAMSGSTPYFEHEIGAGMQMWLQFDCDDLPAAVLVTGGEDGLTVWKEDEDLPYFAVWPSYYGDLTPYPPYNPAVVVHSFHSSMANLPILVRVPAE